MEEKKSENKYAIRFGLGAIKAVGFAVMETAAKEREENGNFKDVYDFAERLDPKSINKKSIEALAKSGAFDSIHHSRRQVAESFEILAAYSNEKKEEATSNQMSLFGGLPEANKKPELKKLEDWTKTEKLQKELEAFGFFLNEHPIDDFIPDLKKRGSIFSNRINDEDLEDGSLVKIAGVIASSKHRSGSRGRFAYLTVSDPFGIFEAMIFDEALITQARDILSDGTSVVLECLIRKDDGGTRILIRDVKKLVDFIQNVKAADEDFEDVKKQVMRKRRFDNKKKEEAKEVNSLPNNMPPIDLPNQVKKVHSKVEIIIRSRDPLFDLKGVLSTCQALGEVEKSTTVLFSIISGAQVSKIELPQKYLIGDGEIKRFKAVAGVIDVEFII